MGVLPCQTDFQFFISARPLRKIVQIVTKINMIMPLRIVKYFDMYAILLVHAFVFEGAQDNSGNGLCRRFYNAIPVKTDENIIQTIQTFYPRRDVDNRLRFNAFY